MEMWADTDQVVAIDLGGTTLKGSLVDRTGRSGSVQRRPTPVAEGGEAVTEAVLEFACDLCEAARASVGIGLAVPGLVDERTGSVSAAANLGWHQVALRRLAQERLALPVSVAHDVRAAALAEGLMGAARGWSDYLLVALGTGIGAAIVIRGQPYIGAHGLGGELGHVAIEPRGRMCGCGRPGCLEAHASAGHIALRYQTMSGARDRVSAKEVAEHAAAGEPIAELVWREAIDALALTIANYACLLDPELVIIGGGMAAAGADLFEPLEHMLRIHMRFGDPPPVVPAELGEQAARYGAAITAWRAAGVQERELESWEPAGAAAQ
jgi:glucokinase